MKSFPFLVSRGTKNFWRSRSQYSLKANISQSVHPIHSMFGSRLGFRGRRIEWCYFRFHNIQDGDWRPSWNDGDVARNVCVSWAFLLLRVCVASLALRRIKVERIEFFLPAKRHMVNNNMAYLMARNNYSLIFLFEKPIKIYVFSFFTGVQCIRILNIWKRQLVQYETLVNLVIIGSVYNLKVHI